MKDFPLHYVLLMLIVNKVGCSLKDKKSITITEAFQKILDASRRKSNKIWVDKGSKFYIRSMKPCLQDIDIEMYLTHNEGKSVVAERFIRTFRCLQYQKM